LAKRLCPRVGLDGLLVGCRRTVLMVMDRLRIWLGCRLLVSLNGLCRVCLGRRVLVVLSSRGRVRLRRRRFIWTTVVTVNRVGDWRARCHLRLRTNAGFHASTRGSRSVMGENGHYFIYVLAVAVRGGVKQGHILKNARVTQKSTHRRAPKAAAALRELTAEVKPGKARSP
jgi:hypothetical protein